jgi:alkylated DNA repair dioxygenase AlkB
MSLPFQQSFNFDENISTSKEFDFQNISLPDAEMFFYDNFFSKSESDLIFENLLSEIEWQQDKIKYYGKEMPLPRLTAWYGDVGISYKYSGIGMSSKPWTQLLKRLKKRTEEVSQSIFNSVLLNLYRDGKDGVSWHQDNEKELGTNPTIASLSFGENRKFQFRHKSRKDVEKFEVLLTHGSLLVMKGSTQDCWQHQIPKTKKRIGQRINLTFRFIS